MNAPTISEIEAASRLVYEALEPTPTIHWPLLDEIMGRKVWLKHENHLPTGAFKVRGGLVYLNRLMAVSPPSGVCAATRGNHGLSIAYASERFDLPCVIFVPEGNSLDKNRAMRALGAEVREIGKDFDESVSYAEAYAKASGLHQIPSFHPDLVLGVASYALEFFTAATELDRVYVPIGLGSGICGILAAKHALGLKVDVIGVVSEAFPTYLNSMQDGQIVMTAPGFTIADGLAVRRANADALGYIQAGVSRIVSVSDDEILKAMGCLFDCTHNVAEGAGVAALAAAFKDRSSCEPDDQIGVVISGGNVSAETLVHAIGS